VGEVTNGGIRWAVFDSNYNRDFDSACGQPDNPTCKGCRKGFPLKRGLCERCLPPNHLRKRR